MRHLILLFLLCCAHHSAQCQHAVAMPVKMNVLYRGIDNPISIAAVNYSCADLILTAGEGFDILPDLNDSCLYRVYAKTYKPVDTLFIKTKTGQLISAQVFRIKSPGAFVPTLDGIAEQGVIKKEELLARKEIKPIRAFSDFDEKIKVIRFQAVSCSGGVLKWLDNYGPVLTASTRDLIREATAGDVILFDGITIYGDNSCSVRISPLKYYLENEPSEKRTFSCAKNQTALYQNYPVAYDEYEFTKYQNICPCTCASKTESTGPDAKGTILKSYYDGSDSTRLLRTEKLLPDSTLVVEEFSNGRIFKQWSIKDKEMVGPYREFNANSTLKLSGQYSIGVIGGDTTLTIDPVTLDEKIQIIPALGSVKSGTWKYFDLNGTLINEEKYGKGKIKK